MYVKDWMDVCNVYRTQSFKMRTHNEVTKEARIKLDYWTCYWFHLFGTPSLFCQFFSSHSPYFLFFLSSFFFFFFFSTNKTRSSRPCSLYYRFDERPSNLLWNLKLHIIGFYDIPRYFKRNTMTASKFHLMHRIQRVIATTILLSLI